MADFKHTPFDGSEPLFRIGLQKLDLKEWIEIDGQLPFYLSEKQRLVHERGDDVFVQEPDTIKAQAEVLELLVAHLLETYPDIYRGSENGSAMEIKPAARMVDLKQSALSPLQIAASLVQEDLILMRKGVDGWRLAAASVCFPSSWSLVEKFSKPLDQIHGPVPGFGPDTKNAEMIYRVFDNLKPELPVRRLNWSVYTDEQLFHDDREAEHVKKEDLSAGAFMRVEHQTLRKLPRSGDILFTVRIHIDPIAAIKREANCAEICDGFIALLNMLNKDELAYKGLSAEFDNLIKDLELLSGEGTDE